jgi:hypothetical protein
MNPIFARIFKVDELTRTVTGRAAQEVIDRDREIFDYTSSKPEFMKWSAEVSADTGGKSLGNVRSMHGNIAAGKLTNIDFNDVEKAIDISAKIVDDNEWDKVLEGVHTGFSIGGRYARKWAEPINGQMIQRYTAVPNEISIVDRPCCPTAKFFSIHKRDGSVVQMEQISEDSDGVVFENGQFVYKGGPGSGPHGGTGRTTYSAGEHEKWKADAKAAGAKTKLVTRSKTNDYHQAIHPEKGIIGHFNTTANGGGGGLSRKSDSGDLLKFEDGKFVFKGGPGSGPQGGKGSHPQRAEKYGNKQRVASAHHANEAAEHAGAHGDKEGMKLSEAAQSATTQALASGKSSQATQAAAHNAARDAHHQAESYHAAVGNSEASGHHGLAADAHGSLYAIHSANSK